VTKGSVVLSSKRFCGGRKVPPLSEGDWIFARAKQHISNPPNFESVTMITSNIASEYLIGRWRSETDAMRIDLSWAIGLLFFPGFGSILASASQESFRHTDHNFPSVAPIPWVSASISFSVITTLYFPSRFWRSRRSSRPSGRSRHWTGQNVFGDGWGFLATSPESRPCRPGDRPETPDCPLKPLVGRG